MSVAAISVECEPDRRVRAAAAYSVPTSCPGLRDTTTQGHVVFFV